MNGVRGGAADTSDGASNDDQGWVACGGIIDFSSRL
jgi:hypothetical protein